MGSIRRDVSAEWGWVWNTQGAVTRHSGAQPPHASGHGVLSVVWSGLGWSCVLKPKYITGYSVYSEERVAEWEAPWWQNQNADLPTAEPSPKQTAVCASPGQMGNKSKAGIQKKKPRKKSASALALTLGWLWPTATVTTEASPFHRLYCELRARLFQTCSRWQGRIKHLPSWSRNKSCMMDDCNIRRVHVGLRQSEKKANHQEMIRRGWGRSRLPGISAWINTEDEK